MKTIQFISILLASMLLACGEDDAGGGDAIYFDDYFQIVDATSGKDWFASHSEYSAQELQMSIVDPDGYIIDWDIPFQQMGQRTVFGPVGLRSSLPSESEVIYYLRFNTQDTDTLRREAPRCQNCFEGNYQGVSSLTYYYNGERSEYLDFRVDESEPVESYLIYQLARTNQTLTDSTYVMTFKKQLN